jgi:hypothetical protein
MTPGPSYIALAQTKKKKTASNSYSIGVLHSHYLGVAVFLASQFLPAANLPQQEIQLSDLNF